MALVSADRVREFSTTLGTGTFTLSGAAVGYQSFSSAIGNGNTCYYAISNPGTTEWEVGLGTVGSGTLARTTVYASSNAGSLVAFSAGTKDVFATYPAEFAAFQQSPATFSTLNATALTATDDSEFTSTGALTISKGTTGEQPGTPTTGMIRYNTTSNEFEGYSGASPTWKSIGGSALSNDTSTSTYIYPLFASSTSGTAQNIYTSSPNYLFKPSTGELQASVITANQGFLQNANTITQSYDIPSNYNAVSAGPITVNSGVLVTVPSGSTWVVV